jgi:hypothetical protein
MKEASPPTEELSLATAERSATRLPCPEKPPATLTSFFADDELEPIPPDSPLN